MRKLFGCLLAGCALTASSASTFAFEAMLANNFALYPRPYSHEGMMTLGAGEYVDIDRCDHGWCAVTHGAHSGYIHTNHLALQLRIFMNSESLAHHDSSWERGDGGRFD
ncbi:hypothetical protein [Methylocystis sp.]|uniref:hypothetical protein n=1 Tax=Methylocystis sp. TaxID=1911079 RepID=UPI003D112D96